MLLTERPFKPQEQDYLLYKFNRFRLPLAVWRALTDVYTGDRRRPADDTLRLLDNVTPLRALGADSAG